MDKEQSLFQILIRLVVLVPKINQTTQTPPNRYVFLFEKEGPKEKAHWKHKRENETTFGNRGSAHTFDQLTWSWAILVHDGYAH